MRQFFRKLKPSRGFAHVLYIILNILLPVLVLMLVKIDFTILALLVILISKWRMFAVRPRFWWANIRANAVDIIVGMSVLGFMTVSPNDWYLVGFAVAWMIWLIFVKPSVSVFWISGQALLGQAAGLLALFAVYPQAPLWVLVLSAGAICYFSAHHFFYSFDEPFTVLLAHIWAYFATALTWVLAHWLVFYWIVAQPALILISLSVILGTMYYLDHFDRLSAWVRRQLVFIGFAVVIILWVTLMYLYWIHGGETIVV